MPAATTTAAGVGRSREGVDLAAASGIWRGWWRGLHRDDGWLVVVRELQRHMRALVGCDTLALWVRLPPSGDWLRIAWDLRMSPVVLPRGVEPHASLERELRPQRYITATLDGPYRRLLDRARVGGGWLLPLVSPNPSRHERQWVGALGLGWRHVPPTEPPSTVGLVSVVWYLVGQRLEGMYTEAVLEAASAQSPPTTAQDWQSLMGALASWLGGDHWALFRLADHRDQPADLSLVAEHGSIPGRGANFVAYMQSHPEALQASALFRAMRQRRVVAVADATRSRLRIPGITPLEPDPADGPRALSVLTLPVGTLRGSGYGVVTVYWRVRYGWQQFGLSIRPWEALRRIMADWWQNMHMAMDALHDPLTGALNRNGVAQAWAATCARGAGGVVGIVDIDYFSEVNNRWGHLMGDEVLRVLSEILSEVAARCGGWCGRWGGDEFVLCLGPDADWVSVGGDIQDLLDSRGAGREWPQRVTLSGGGARWRRRPPAWEAVVSRADRMLYRAKHRGRAMFVG
jgi:diguanylate cyclase (GGDEF)-like protein